MAEPATKPEQGVEPTDVHGSLKAYLEKSPTLSAFSKPEEINAEESEDTEAEVVQEEEDQVEGDDAFDDDTEDSGDLEEEAEDNEAEFESEEDEESEEPEDIFDRKVKVKVDGEDVEVTVREAADGYLRTEDYQRKTQEVANIKRSLIGESEELKQGLEMVQAFMTAELKAYEGFDWEGLKAEDPNKYLLKREEYESAARRVQGVYATYQQVMQQQAEKQAELMQEHAQEELKILQQQMPELADESKRKAIGQTWLNAAKGFGFTEEEFLNTADHRLFIMLDKAQKYDELMANREKVTKKKVQNKGKKVVKGQRRDTDASQKQRNEQAVVERFQKQQNVDSAADLIAQRLRS